MTAHELIKEYKKNRPHGHYFDDETLRFFGDDLKTATVELVNIKTTYGTIDAYKYTANQRNAPTQPYYHTAYFDADTFAEVEPI